MTDGGVARVIPVIHAVTDAAIVSAPTFLERAAAVMDILRHRGAIHLRAPGVSGALLYRIAEQLAPLQAGTGCPLVVNDRVDIALAVGAWGVQLGEGSIPPDRCAAVAPALARGVSVHSSERLTERGTGCSWIMAGNVFETGTHPGTPARGVEWLADLVRRTPAGVPVIAIGGVTPDRVAAVRAAGGYGVAALSGIWLAPSASGGAADYLSRYGAD